VRRRAARTVLLVGEGDADVLFLQHLKALYVQRGSGVAVTIKNARGKGAAHVVDFAWRQSLNAAYDVVAALLDTDTDWNDKTRSAARKARVHVVPCEPCLEAILLTAHLVSVRGRTTTQLKQDFTAQFGAAASESCVLKHFPRDVIESARARVDVLQQLVHLLAHGKAAGPAVRSHTR
jgi:hypothetical protein